MSSTASGGGPVLVRAGKPVFRANEQFTPDQLLARTARTAVGQLADGRLLLVTVDGAQPGYSAGVTNFELALELVEPARSRRRRSTAAVRRRWPSTAAC